MSSESRQDRRRRQQRERCKERYSTDSAYRDKMAVRNALYGKKLRTKRRDICFDRYGTACKCCGEGTWEFLCIDHINGGGNEHRRATKGKSLYTWLIQNNFPDGFQTLCHNCNMAKGFYGMCPHKVEATVGMQ